MNRVQQSLLRNKIHKVFLPGTPIDKYALLAGRTDQLVKAQSAVLQPGRHMIIFGEKGVGKTSVAQVLLDIKNHDGYRVLKSKTVNCDASDDFSSLWHKAFRVLPAGDEAGKPITLDRFAPDVLVPDDIRDLLSRFNDPSLLVLDETDQLRDMDARNLLAATIKNLSDHAVDTTIVLVGVADTVDELIAEHRSIERALVQIRMPRMSKEENLEIINNGLKELSMTIEGRAQNLIGSLSQRLPFYTHSFGLYSGLRAINDGRINITLQDVSASIADVAMSAENVRIMYHTATHSPHQNNRYETALIAFALIPVDELSSFSASKVGRYFSILSGKRMDVSDYKRYLAEFCSAKRGPILHRIGEPRRYRYRFIDPLMPPFVMINAFGTGQLTNEQLDEMLGVPAIPETVH